MAQPPMAFINITIAVTDPTQIGTLSHALVVDTTKPQEEINVLIDFLSKIVGAGISCEMQVTTSTHFQETALVPWPPGSIHKQVVYNFK